MEISEEIRKELVSVLEKNVSDSMQILQNMIEDVKEAAKKVETMKKLPFCGDDFDKDIKKVTSNYKEVFHDVKTYVLRCKRLLKIIGDK